MKSNFLTFYLKNDSVYCYFVQLKQQQYHLILEEEHKITYDQIVIDSILTAFIEEVVKLSKKSEKVLCRIIFSADLLLKQKIKIPNVALSQYDIEQYIQSSLAKLFQTKQNLAYDYIQEDEQNDKQYKFIQIVACEQNLIDHYQRLLSGIKLNFIGAMINPFEHLANKEIALIEKLDGVNLLPWRDAERRFKRKYFGTFIVLGMFIGILTFGYLHVNATQRLTNLIESTQQHKTRQSEKMQQLALLVDLQHQITVLKKSIAYNESIQKRFLDIINSLENFPALLPDGVWLTSLDYGDNKIKLKGNSFQNSAIWQFHDNLSTLNQISQNHITLITQNNYLLQFEIDTKFNTTLSESP